MKVWKGLYSEVYLVALCLTVVTLGVSTKPETIVCDTTKGEVKIEVHREWAPKGAEQFLDLVERGFFTDICMFRKNLWIVQFGAVQHPQKGARAQFENMQGILDDPQTDCGGKCTKGLLFDGALSFAGGGPNTRTNQLFFVHNLADQPIGHSPWEVPIGNITSGLDVVRKMYGEYGEKVDQVKIFEQGDEYVKQNFPNLDYIYTCTVMEEVESNKFIGIVKDQDSVAFSIPGSTLVIVVLCFCGCYHFCAKYLFRGKVLERGD